MPTPIGESFRGPDGRLGYLLRQAHQALRAQIDQAARAEGITAPQFSIMSALDHEPGLTGAEVARQSMLRPQTANEILANLERSGLVERREHPHDRRTRQVHLTARGRERFAKVNEKVAAIERRALPDATPQQRREFAERLVECALVFADADRVRRP
jgi:DNA-binding MarR family transcriptional regulator